MNLKVSICIPAFKQVTILRKVLDSILIQTYENYELIITDDTPDNSIEILLKEYDFKGKLKYFKNPVALGSPANWNYAISLAKGEYIKILHGDDFFTSAQSLAKYVEMLDSNPDAVFGFSASKIWNISTNGTEIFSCSPKHLKRLQYEPDFLFFRNIIGGPSATIYRTELNVKYDTALKWLVDVDFYMRALDLKKGIAYSSEPLVCTSDGAEGQITQALSNNKEFQIKEHVILFNKLQEIYPGLNKSKFSLYFKLLFNKYAIKSMEELDLIIPISKKNQPFFSKVISSVNTSMILSRILVKFYNSWLNKNILKMELF